MLTGVHGLRHATHTAGGTQSGLSQTTAGGATASIHGLGLLVGLAIEIAEQVKEDDRVAHEEEGQCLGHVAALGAHGQHVAQDEDELDQLDAGHVLLPPQVLLVLGSHCGHHVVEVHDNVHARVENANDYALLAGSVLQVAPGEEHRDGVMVHVEERHLVVLLAQHKERRVQQIDDLREKVEPGTGIEGQILLPGAVNLALLRKDRRHHIALLDGLQKKKRKGEMNPHIFYYF